jgi:hypothetical protein
MNNVKQVGRTSEGRIISAVLGLCDDTAHKDRFCLIISKAMTFIGKMYWTYIVCFIVLYKFCLEHFPLR